MKKRFSRAVLFLLVLSLCTFAFGIISFAEGETPEIHWSFESGELDPFTVTEGAFGAKIIANWDRDRNNLTTGQLVGKDGTYYLCTVETDGTTAYNEAYRGTIQSPVFQILDPTITMKLAGGPNAANYVAVCRYSDDAELARVTKPGAGSHIFAAATLTIPNDKYVAGEAVYLKIVDGTTSNWAFISVDDIRVKGELYTGVVADVKWSFEDGTTAPFTYVKGNVGKPIGNRDTEMNSPKASILKDGTYYLTTVEKTAETADDAMTAEFRSPNFTLSKPVIKFKLAGGAVAGCYVALCMKSGAELARVSPAASRYIFQERSIDTSSLGLEPETQVFLKIVDSASGGWAFIAVDDIRFTGQVVEDPVVDIRFDFENGGALEPWRMISGNVETYIGSRDVDFNGGVPMQKQGTYYLTSVEKDNGNSNDDRFTGVFRSPVFTVDVENDPVVKFKIGGGASTSDLYMAIRRKPAGDLVAKATSSRNLYVFEERQIDLTGLVTKYDQLYIEVVDNRTAGWGCIIFDDFRARGTFPPELPLSSEAEVAELTGWTAARFSQLKLPIQDLVDTYGGAYPRGAEYLSEIVEKEALHKSFWQEGYLPNDPAVESFKAEMDALEFEALTSNPLLTAQPIAIVARRQYAGDHHNTHNMFPSGAGEYNDGAYSPGGAVRVIDFAQGGAVSTLAESSTGVFRDPDVSYDGGRLLLSHRTSVADSYHIYEYQLNADKTAFEGAPKQLTTMLNADDMDPMYMPSGNIVFGSTRDPKYVMCNRHIAANIYRMEGDGANIVKITNSTLFERPTDVLPDGRILYDRWEYNDRDFGSAQGLWTVAEDGTQQVTYYGNNSPDGAAIDAKAIPGTQNVMLILSSTHDRAWGALAILDRSQGVDGRAPVLRTWPASVISGIRNPDGGTRNIDRYLSVSPKYEDPQPLSDKYFLVSRQIPGKGEKMGIYLLDLFGNETLIYEDANANYGAFDATLLAPREKEHVASSRRNYLDQTGSFFVQNVYEGTHMQNVTPGEVKWLRIVESMPKNYITRNNQWGGEGQQNPGVNWHSFEVKKTIGEVPVYEDGSAYFEVPQDRFVYFQLLDEDGRMIQSMRSGTLVQSGEKTGCIGCHDDRRISVPTTTTKDTPIALKESFEVIANPDYTEGSNLPKTIGVNVPDKPQKRFLDFETGTDYLVDYDSMDYDTELPSMNYLTEVQPIFTKNCLDCHGYENIQGDLTLVPDKTVIFNASYIDLWRSRGESSYFNRALTGSIGAGGQEFVPAKGWGSYNSPLIKQIYDNEAHAARLTDAEKRRVAEWVDLNGTYYGDYASNYAWGPAGRSPMTSAELGQIQGFSFNWSWSESRHAPVYFDNPEKSPVLKNLTGDAYTRALAAINVGRDRLIAKPDVDWAGLTVMPGDPNTAITPYTRGAQDAWRYSKLQLRNTIEAANRAAIAAGIKRYDWDNAGAGLLEWPAAAFPGWNE